MFVRMPSWPKRFTFSRSVASSACTTSRCRSLDGQATNTSWLRPKSDGSKRPTLGLDMHRDAKRAILLGRVNTQGPEPTISGCNTALRLVRLLRNSQTIGAFLLVSLFTSPNTDTPQPGCTVTRKLENRHMSLGLTNSSGRTHQTVGPLKSPPLAPPSPFQSLKGSKENPWRLSVSPKSAIDSSLRGFPLSQISQVDSFDFHMLPLLVV